MTQKIFLKQEMKNLIEEIISKNKSGRWIDDRDSTSFEYNNFLTTIYFSRAVLEFYTLNLAILHDIIKDKWDLKDTVEYLSSDLAVYAAEWKKANISIQINELDVLLHFKALSVHSLVTMVPYLIFTKNDSLLYRIREKSIQYLSHFAELQDSEGYINNPERVFFTSRKLVTAYFTEKHLGGESITESGLNIKEAVNFLLSRIDKKEFLVLSIDPNFNTHMEESAITLEALTLWKHARLQETDLNVKKLADSIYHNIPKIYGGSSHDLNHVIKALFEHFGHDKAFRNPKFNRIFIKFYELVKEKRFLNESRSNHPYSEIFYTLATIAKSHEHISALPSCFISYSTKDREFVSRLHSDLEKQGIECWIASHDAKFGRKLHEQIKEAILKQDRFLLVLSLNSINSEWVKSEIAFARKKEKEEGLQILFPISLVDFKYLRDWECFDADIGKDSAREVREYFIPDFSNWENVDLYKDSFDKLIKNLRD